MPGGRRFRTMRAAAPGGVPGARGPGGVPGRLVQPLLVGLTGAAGVVLVAVVSPERPGHYPVCPTYALTGLYCPGCGGLRAVHALCHGDLTLALHRNAVVVLGVPLAIWAYLAWVRRSLLGRPAAWFPPKALLWGGAVALIGFTLLRNLPGFGWLAP
jgi:Protein of unknown function (DUF2752)